MTEYLCRLKCQSTFWFSGGEDGEVSTETRYIWAQEYIVLIIDWLWRMIEWHIPMLTSSSKMYRGKEAMEG